MTPVYLEVGKRRSFACSTEWPGWERCGRDVDSALETFRAYHGRYAATLSDGGFSVPVPGEIEVIETLTGNASTDFGVPGAISTSDRRPSNDADTDRLAAIVLASWSALDRAAAEAVTPLTTGPRGGGRRLDAIVEHVVDSDRAYARKVGVRLHSSTDVDEHRTSIIDALRRPGNGPWPTRYFARRLAWHALDHAWEIEDRSS